MMTTEIALALTGLMLIAYWLIRGLLGTKHTISWGWALWFASGWLIVLAAVWLEWSK